MRTLCIAITPLLLLAGCGTGLYVFDGDLWSLDGAMSRADGPNRHVFLTRLCDLYKQANKKDRKAVVQKYWSVMLELSQSEGRFRPDEVESLRAMADPDFRQQVDTIAAIEEEQDRRRKHAKAEEANKAQQEEEQIETKLRQLERDTATFIQQHSGKSIRNLTVIEVDERVQYIEEVFSLDGCFSTEEGDQRHGWMETLPVFRESTFSRWRRSTPSLEKPEDYEPLPVTTCFPLTGICTNAWESTIGVKLSIIKKTEDFRMAVILESQAF